MKLNRSQLRKLISESMYDPMYGMKSLEEPFRSKVMSVIDDPEASEEDLKQFQQLNDRLIERALKMGGTCTGEHGVGIGKIHYMRAEHGESVEMMRQIKQALDPLNLFNPGKLVPA